LGKPVTVHGVGVERLDGSEEGGGDETISISSSTDAIVIRKELSQKRRVRPVQGTASGMIKWVEAEIAAISSCMLTEPAQHTSAGRTGRSIASHFIPFSSLL
jgi:hypothetical protein